MVACEPRPSSEKHSNHIYSWETTSQSHRVDHMYTPRTILSVARVLLSKRKEKLIEDLRDVYSIPKATIRHTVNIPCREMHISESANIRRSIGGCRCGSLQIMPHEFGLVPQLLGFSTLYATSSRIALFETTRSQVDEVGVL